MSSESPVVPEVKSNQNVFDCCAERKKQNRGVLRLPGIVENKEKVRWLLPVVCKQHPQVH